MNIDWSSPRRLLLVLPKPASSLAYIAYCKQYRRAGTLLRSLRRVWASLITVNQLKS